LFEIEIFKHMDGTGEVCLMCRIHYSGQAVAYRYMSYAHLDNLTQY